MMKMNAGAWIGIIGGIIALLVGVGSVVATGGSMGIYMGAFMLLMFGGMFYLFYRLFFKHMINSSRLQKIGIDGTATITAIADTGVTINRSPQLKLTLDVKSPLGQRYTATTRALVSRINPMAYRPGMQVPVKIDPNDEKNVVINMNAMNGFESPAGNISQPQDIAVLETTLQQMQKDNDAILASGKSARAIVKKFTPLGVNVNGANPYVELELEVLPEVMPSFSGIARGVIGEVSIQKFQPGKTIHVKYDLYDNSKIAIERSGD